jgi:hypothetical protein
MMSAMPIWLSVLLAVMLVALEANAERPGQDGRASANAKTRVQVSTIGQQLIQDLRALVAP